jgi:hypothetical protein
MNQKKRKENRSKHTRLISKSKYLALFVLGYSIRTCSERLILPAAITFAVFVNKNSLNQLEKPSKLLNKAECSLLRLT